MLEVRLELVVVDGDKVCVVSNVCVVLLELNDSLAIVAGVDGSVVEAEVKVDISNKVVKVDVSEKKVEVVSVLVKAFAASGTSEILMDASGASVVSVCWRSGGKLNGGAGSVGGIEDTEPPPLPRPGSGGPFPPSSPSPPSPPLPGPPPSPELGPTSTCMPPLGERASKRSIRSFAPEAW